MPPSASDTGVLLAPHDANSTNYTLAAAVAGTILNSDNQPVFAVLFSYVVGGIFASFGTAWQDLLWVVRSPARRKAQSRRWHSAIDPDGEHYVPVRKKALRANWEAAMAGQSPGLLRQGSDNVKPGDDVAAQDEKWGDWGDLAEEKRKLEERERLRKEAGGHSGDVPSYVLEYAPLIHLYSKEEYWPGDIDLHLRRTVPQLNFTDVGEEATLDNLSLFNQYAPYIYLTSKDDPEAHPGWLSARFNIPDTKTYKCDAPGTLIWVDKGNGVVDAFWFYFYSYNLGNVVFNVRFGNHVGDWEHSMVRFVNGKPKWMFLSQHAGGDAYVWDALEKQGKRVHSPLLFTLHTYISMLTYHAKQPVIYSAIGTHANYATAGKQEYIVPLGLLADNTDTGPLWDLTLNSRMYNYNLTNKLLLPAANNPEAPIAWFYFDGHWGDKFYPFNDTRQYGLLGEAHYISGPLGPRWKNLGRKTVCQRDDEECIIMTQLRYGRKRWEWEADPLDGGLDVPWWALGGLDWYLVCWFMVEWVVAVFVIHAFK
ncbi:Vacuolar protein sorting-associated protein 62 [Orbilia brochopaga]|uniref:Vacuolar protein sorting-associated protein 62 n=1 Tax=Orbilia brochopaga TaxID=3140254 RepID=A0AAV9VIX9_9PEZI